MSALKKGASRKHLVFKEKPRTSAYKQFGARHGETKKVKTHHLPHADHVYMRKGRVDTDNSTVGNRSFR